MCTIIPSYCLSTYKTNTYVDKFRLRISVRFKSIGVYTYLIGKLWHMYEIFRVTHCLANGLRSLSLVSAAICVKFVEIQERWYTFVSFFFMWQRQARLTFIDSSCSYRPKDTRGTFNWIKLVLNNVGSNSISGGVEETKMPPWCRPDTYVSVISEKWVGTYRNFLKKLLFVLFYFLFVCKVYALHFNVDDFISSC